MFEVKENALIVAAGKNDASERKTYLHRSSANRAFEKRFQLSDQVYVEIASQIDNMIRVNYIRQVPETLKPQLIEIMGVETKAQPPKAVN